MLSYSSIPTAREAKHETLTGQHCIAFYKHDGSNLRFEWNPKKGWHKFGTRKQLFDSSTPLYNQALPIFNEQLASLIEYKVKSIYGQKVERITAFAEFLGASSFSGQHIHDEAKMLKLFDVSVFKQGFIDPARFAELFKKHEPVSEVVYIGKYDPQLTYDAWRGELNGVKLNEGVVFKMVHTDVVFKAKTEDWVRRVKEKYGQSWESFV